MSLLTGGFVLPLPDRVSFAGSDMDALDHILPLVAKHAGGRLALAGTAFCFRDPNTCLTAAHCVDGRRPDDLAIWNRDSSILSPLEVLPNGEADIALLRFPAGVLALVPFWDFVSNYALGEDYATFGFPYEDLTSGRNLTPRFFKGYFQRLFRYQHGPWTYDAAELSAPAPQGLSGAPVFRPTAPQMLTSLVTENVQSYTIVDQVEETSDAGGRSVQTARRVVEYGIALRLDSVSAWLDRLVPRPDRPVAWSS
jgi:hypothetical protein